MKTFDESAMDVKVAMGNEALTRGLPKGAILALALVDAEGNVIVRADQIGTAGLLLLKAETAEAAQDVLGSGSAFSGSGTLVKAVKATGSVVFAGGVPTDGQIVTIDDGVNDPVVFEFDHGTFQVETATAAGTVTGAGNATITVTANGMGNSPKAISVAVAGGDTASDIATKVRAALTADGDVAAFFTVSGATDAVILTALTKAANDATMNIASADGTSHGVTTSATSANTTAGVAPVAQVETATAAGNISTSGNLSVIVTAAGMTNSPKTVTVAVLDTDDDGSAIATKIRAALEADADVGHITTGFFTVSGATDAIILTAKTAAANDATLNIALYNDTSVGLTTATTSANTTAGVAGTLQVETATIAGTVTGAGNATVVTTAAGMSGSPITTSVAVAEGDTASAWATKVRAALNLDANITAFFTVGGSGTAISLTRLAGAANDATMNISLDNDTCFGITTAATSANTTAGAAAGSGAVSGSNVAVAIGASANATATNFHTAVNGASSLDITSTNSPAGTCALQNDLGGTAGNVTITENASNVTVTGMSGGADTADVTLLAAAGVPAGFTIQMTGFTITVDGATAWNEATDIQIKDGADNIFATITKAALTGNSVTVPGESGVTLGALWPTGGVTSIKATTSGENELAGSDAVIRVWGFLVPG